MRYTIAAIPAGWVVATRTATGRLVAASEEFTTRGAAERHAQRLNQAWQQFLAESAASAAAAGQRFTTGLNRLANRRRVADLGVA